jgi:single-stranded DNA-specific DHH superfamily exonuclease
MGGRSAPATFFLLLHRASTQSSARDAERTVKLLTTEDEAEARAIANILEMENRHRKDIDEGTFREALVSADELFD